MRKYFLTIAALASFVSFSSVEAATIFSENTSYNPPKGNFSSVETGTLTSDSRITFKYTLTNFTPYALADGIENASGGAFSFKSPLGNLSMQSALLFATSNITGNVETLVITNLSKSVADYFSFISGVFGSHGHVKFSENEVSPISAVPLPASLPMFGLGLALLAGFGIKRKNRA